MTTVAVEPIGWSLITAERRRQVDVEGWRPDHDDQHTRGELEQAARAYLAAIDGRAGIPRDWPWASTWWKPRDRTSNLVRAGALYLAEAERYERAGNPTAAARLRRAAMGVAEGLSKFIDRGPVPAPREEHSP